MSLPFNLIFPESIGYTPLMMLTNDVFPEPFGPINPVTIPGLIFMLIELRAHKFPNDLQTSFNSYTEQTP